MSFPVIGLEPKLFVDTRLWKGVESFYVRKMMLYYAGVNGIPSSLCSFSVKTVFSTLEGPESYVSIQVSHEPRRRCHEEAIISLHEANHHIEHLFRDDRTYRIHRRQQRER